MGAGASMLKAAQISKDFEASVMFPRSSSNLRSTHTTNFTHHQINPNKQFVKPKEIRTLDELKAYGAEVFTTLEAQFAGGKDSIFIAFVLNACLKDLYIQDLKLEKNARLSLVDTILEAFPSANIDITALISMLEFVWFSLQTSPAVLEKYRKKAVVAQEEGDILEALVTEADPLF